MVIPVYNIKSATTIPIYPSIFFSKKWVTSIPTITAEVATTSVKLSIAVACNVAEQIIFPIFLLKKHNHNFTNIEHSIIKNDSKWNVISWGCIILSKEAFKSSIPINIIIRETTNPATYSYLPWPKGCSSSGGLSAKWKPKSVATEEAASDKLFKASAIIDTEDVIIPANNFTQKSIKLQNIPTYPLITPYFFLVSLSMTSLLTKYFNISFIIHFPQYYSSQMPFTSVKSLVLIRYFSIIFIGW